MEIRFTDVTKSFGRTVAIDEVDLEIGDGERVGLVGPNGSGKTTLIRLAIGLIAGEGEVRVGGVDPFEQRPEIASQVAYVPQIAPAFDVLVGRLTDAVCRARQVERRRARQLSERFDFALERHADKPYRDLSGGMKQKLLIALALAGDPQLLVMDEPTASLDASTRATFFETCAEMEESTLILCSHRLEEIRHLVDAIVELQDGRVAQVRSVADFVAASGRVVVECQFQEGATPEEAELQKLGLHRIGDGVWSGIFDWEQKMPTLRTLVDRYGSSIDDLAVDDVTELGGIEADAS